LAIFYVVGNNFYLKSARPGARGRLAARLAVASVLGLPVVVLARSVHAGATPSDMVVHVDTTASGCSSSTVGLPLQSDPNSGSVTPNVSVDWGDGSTEAVTSASDVTHTYVVSGAYTITITPTASSGPSLTQFGDPGGWTGSSCLTSVSQWGSLGLTSLAGAFAGDASLVSVPATIPAGIKSLNSTFSYATSFNGDVSGWDTSQVTDMSRTFVDAYAFNQNIGSWDTSQVTSMQTMFGDDSCGQVRFNNGGSPSISTWDTSKVTNMNSMFFCDHYFTQALGRWSIASITDMAYMLSNTALSMATYDAMLDGWAAQASVPHNISIGVDGLVYSASDTGHQTLSSTYGWTFNGDSAGPAVPNLTEARIDGAPLVGGTLNADFESSGPFTRSTGRVSLQWYRCTSPTTRDLALASVPAGCDPIIGATGTSLSVGSSLLGHYVTYVATAGDGGQLALAASVGPVTRPSPPIVSPPKAPQAIGLTPSNSAFGQGIIDVSDDGTNVWSITADDTSASPPVPARLIKTSVSTGISTTIDIPSFDASFSPASSISSDGTSVWVTFAGWDNSFPFTGAIMKYDIASGAWSTIGSALAGAPMSVSTDGTHAWVVFYGDCMSSHTVLGEYEAGSGALVRTIDPGIPGCRSAGTYPQSVYSDGVHVWWAVPTPSEILEVAPDSGSVVSTFTSPYNINSPTSITSDGTDVWFVNDTSSSATCPDAAASSGSSSCTMGRITIATGAVASFASTFVQDPYSLFSDGTYVYLSNSGWVSQDLGQCPGGADPPCLPVFNIATSTFGALTSMDGVSVYGSYADSTQTSISWDCNAGAFQATRATAKSGLVHITPAERPPGAPTGVRAVVEGTEVVVTWVRPRCSNYSPITSFTVSVGGKTCATAGALTCRVRDVPPGTHGVSVTATNAAGASPHSASVDVTVAAPTTTTTTIPPTTGPTIPPTTGANPPTTASGAGSQLAATGAELPRLVGVALATMALGFAGVTSRRRRPSRPRRS
jgi:surface protein